MVTLSSVLTQRIPMDRGAWQATLWGYKESDTTERLSSMKNGDMKEQVQRGQTLQKNFTTIGKWALVGGKCGFQTVYACRCVSVLLKLSDIG